MPEMPVSTRFGRTPEIAIARLFAKRNGVIRLCNGFCLALSYLLQVNARI
jgi:hypothetical protein